MDNMRLEDFLRGEIEEREKRLWIVVHAEPPRAYQIVASETEAQRFTITEHEWANDNPLRPWQPGDDLHPWKGSFGVKSTVKESATMREVAEHVYSLDDIQEMHFRND